VAEAQMSEAKAAYGRGDYTTSLMLWRPLADRGIAGAQNDLGVMYDNGQGVPQDYAEATRWFHKAADQGLAGAQNSLGLMYEKGEGVSQDYAEAAKWYRKAAEQGLAQAQVNLAFVYTNGQGVPQDYAEAMRWLRKAADQGDANAENDLGLMYEKGQGAAQDYAEAVKWYRKAADQGLAGAEHALAVMYAKGQGVPQNDAEMMRWLYKAADQGDPDARRALTAIEAAQLPACDSKNVIDAIPRCIGRLVAGRCKLNTVNFGSITVTQTSWDAEARILHCRADAWAGMSRGTLTYDVIVAQDTTTHGPGKIAIGTWEFAMYVVQGTGFGSSFGGSGVLGNCDWIYLGSDVGVDKECRWARGPPSAA
jgi:hypothetical protein